MERPGNNIRICNTTCPSREHLYNPRAGEIKTGSGQGRHRHELQFVKKDFFFFRILPNNVFKASSLFLEQSYMYLKCHWRKTIKKS